MNEKDFGRVLEMVFERSSRTFPQFLNGQALRMSSFAVDATEKADANKIAWALGQSGRVFTSKTGKTLKTPRRKYSAAASRNLYRIINWRRKRVGLKALGGKAMSKVARSMRAAALRSTSFIASGWIYAVRGLAKAVGYGDFSKRPKSARMTGNEKGFVFPAVFTLSGIVSCTIGNSALLAQSAKRTGARLGRPMRIAERGLSIARNMTAKDMLAHLARKVQPILTQHSAR